MGWGKVIVAAAIALLLGIFIGGLGPRAELARAQEARAEAEARARQAGGAGLPLALGLGSLAAARAQADRAASDERTRVPRFVPSDPNRDDVAPDAGANPREIAIARGANPVDVDAGAATRRNAFRAAQAAADLRAAQFRAAFLEEARLPPAGVAAVDASVKTM
ncbi:MAG TPA: hypothetical protein VGG33_11830, partial [Polyangia bacterium]